MRHILTLLFVLIAFPACSADTPDMSLYLKKTDIFDGDVRGTYRSLLLKQPAAIIQKTIISSTTISSQDGADITNLDASNILRGILPWARLDVMTGGDLSGYLPAPQVIDDSHNHTPATLPGVETSTAAAIAYASIGQSTGTLKARADALDISTAALTARATALDVSTSALTARANALDISTAALAARADSIAVSTAALAVSTGTLDTNKADKTGPFDWSYFSNFPATCSPQCVVAVGATLTCGPCGGASGGGNTYTTGGVAGQIPVYVAVDSITASGLIPSQVRTTTTAITGADVNTDILLSTNPYIAKTNQYNQFTSSQSITVSFAGEGKGFEVINSVTPPSMANDRIGILGAAAATPGTYGAWGIGVAGFGTGYNGLPSYGIYGIASGPSNNYGVYGAATGTGGDINYGVYGKASGATLNWAGYFDGAAKITGNTTIDGTLTVTSGINPASVNLSTTASKSSDNNFSATQTFQYGIVVATITANTIDAGIVEVSSTCVVPTNVATQCTATCASGYYAISGGYTGSNTYAPYLSRRVAAGTAWATAYYCSSQTSTTYAYCAKIK